DPGSAATAASAPLVATIFGDESPIGFLAVAQPGNRAFSDDDRHFLEGAARVLAARAPRERAAEHQAALTAPVRHAAKMQSHGAVAGGIAHDFNNLLMPILGHASLGSADAAEGSVSREHLQQIEETAQRAADLTNQLLAYAGKGKFVI